MIPGLRRAILADPRAAARLIVLARRRRQYRRRALARSVVAWTR